MLLRFLFALSAGILSLFIVVGAPCLASPAAAAGEAQAYRDQLSSIILASRHYPTSEQAARLHPRGMVTVRFVLAREGTLLSSEILSPNSHRLLNEATLETLSHIRFPPFPATAWPGQASRSFVIELAYAPPSP